jgi:hypothetical protein
VRHSVRLVVISLEDFTEPFSAAETVPFFDFRNSLGKTVHLIGIGLPPFYGRANLRCAARRAIIQTPNGMAAPTPASRRVRTSVGIAGKLAGG